MSIKRELRIGDVVKFKKGFGKVQDHLKVLAIKKDVDGCVVYSTVCVKASSWHIDYRYKLHSRNLDIMEFVSASTNWTRGKYGIQTVKQNS